MHYNMPCNRETH